MTSYNHLLISHPAEYIAQVALLRPEAANALNSAIALEIKGFFESLSQDTRCIILTGTGKHFCAGADLKERLGMSDDDWKAQHAHFRAARDAVMGCPIPVIAAVNGAAFGGGLELSLACDFIYAADTASFALTEVSLGIMPGMGGTQTLPEAIGARRAKELLFTAQKFSAKDAYELGMVNKICAPQQLLEEALACAKMIAANAPLSVRAIKQASHHTIDFQKELALYNQLLASRDRHEGISAFNEKRRPQFIGE